MDFNLVVYNGDEMLNLILYDVIFFFFISITRNQTIVTYIFKRV